MSFKDKDVKRAADIIIAKSSFVVEPVSHPTMTIVGGQPGAGKSNLKRFMRRDFARNILMLDGDEYRSFHPEYKEIQKNEPLNMSELTQDFSEKVHQKIKDYCLENSLNFSFETTFRNSKRISDEISAAKKNNLFVDVRLMAVNPVISRIYTLERYRSGLHNDGEGRSVSKRAHDERAAVISDVVKDVESFGKYDSFFIYGRGFDSVNEITYLVEKDPVNVHQTFLNERDRNFSFEELYHLTNVVNGIVNDPLLKSSLETRELYDEFKEYFPGITLNDKEIER